GFARGCYPPPPVLKDAASRWSSGELFWIIRNGIKMSGMPAWPDHSDEDIWNIVAFLGRLPAMTETDYGNLVKESLEAGGDATHANPPAHPNFAPEQRAAGHFFNRRHPQAQIKEPPPGKFAPAPCFPA